MSSGRCTRIHACRRESWWVFGPVTDPPFFPQSIIHPRRQQELAREQRPAEEGGQVALVVKGGRLFVDVRDSGDAWIRVAVGKGEGVVLPNGVWRCVLFWGVFGVRVSGCMAYII